MLNKLLCLLLIKKHMMVLAYTTNPVDIFTNANTAERVMNEPLYKLILIFVYGMLIGIISLAIVLEVKIP